MRAAAGTGWCLRCPGTDARICASFFNMPSLCSSFMMMGRGYTFLENPEQTAVNLDYRLLNLNLHVPGQHLLPPGGGGGIKSHIGNCKPVESVEVGEERAYS